MNEAFRRSVAVTIAIAVAISTSGEVYGKGAAARQPRARYKLDHSLREDVAGGDETQRVIIRVRPGQRGALQRALEAHGDEVIADHESIDALSARVHTPDSAGLAEQADVLSVSTDAVVHAKLLGELIGGVVQLTGAVVNSLGSIVGVVLPNGADTEGPAIAPAVLRETLGVGSTWTGRGVGIAIIDSGLEMSSEF